jgi:hypothetical protein
VWCAKGGLRWTWHPHPPLSVMIDECPNLLRTSHHILQEWDGCPLTSPPKDGRTPTSFSRRGVDEPPASRRRSSAKFFPHHTFFPSSCHCMTSNVGGISVKLFPGLFSPWRGCILIIQGHQDENGGLPNALPDSSLPFWPVLRSVCCHTSFPPTLPPPLAPCRHFGIWRV